MYNAFFGFKEKPFKLVPNPEFLFLSKVHEEALAHLEYTTSQGDGFALITGEVGTGKTTLCRVFLEDLDQNIEAAFIFNSKLDAVQLLKAVHTELNLQCNSDDPADMTDNLNRFLLEKKSQGKSVILLIDEAQHLGKETLEQIRLLSNLETTKSKLLQILLVGQPELIDMLDDHELRQLRQRINLSCYILPLTLKETQDYISHRVNVASRKNRELFSRKAKKIIHHFSGGIPRKINIICDRCLLVAYSRSATKINAAVAGQALKELEPMAAQKQTRKAFSFRFALPVVLIICVLVSAVFIFDTFYKQQPETQKKPALNSMHSVPLRAKPEKKSFSPLVSIHQGISRADALGKIIRLWGAPPDHEFDFTSSYRLDDTDFFRVSAMQNNFLALKLSTGQKWIDTFKLPAVVKLLSPQKRHSSYLVVHGITPENDLVLTGDDITGVFSMSSENLARLIEPDIFILCRNVFGPERVIAQGASKTSVLSVKLHLRQMGFLHIELTPVFDNPVKDAVMEIQKAYDLKPDGLVGPLTKLALMVEKKDAGTPLLNPLEFSGKPEPF